MAVLLLKNIFGLDGTADPKTVGETIAKTFNVSAAKFTGYGPADAILGDKFVRGKTPTCYLLETDDDTANNMKKQRPNDVSFMGPCGPC